MNMSYVRCNFTEMQLLKLKWTKKIHIKGNEDVFRSAEVSLVVNGTAQTIVITLFLLVAHYINFLIKWLAGRIQ